MMDQQEIDDPYYAQTRDLLKYAEIRQSLGGVSVDPIFIQKIYSIFVSVAHETATRVNAGEPYDKRITDNLLRTVSALL